MLRKLSVLLLVTVAAAAPLLTTPRSLIGSRIPDFNIEDQFEREWKSSSFKGTTTVYVLSGRDGHEYSENWTRVLIPRFKNSPVRFVPVADVQEVPGFLKGFIRSQFKEKFKYSVLLDWEGTLISAFNMTKGYPNFVVVGRDGVVRHVTHGKGNSRQVEALATKLQQILDGK